MVSIPPFQKFLLPSRSKDTISNSVSTTIIISANLLYTVVWKYKNVSPLRQSTIWRKAWQLTFYKWGVFWKIPNLQVAGEYSDVRLQLLDGSWPRPLRKGPPLWAQEDKGGICYQSSEEGRCHRERRSWVFAKWEENIPDRKPKQTPFPGQHARLLPGLLNLFL